MNAWNYNPAKSAQRTKNAGDANKRNNASLATITARFILFAPFINTQTAEEEMRTKIKIAGNTLTARHA